MFIVSSSYDKLMATSSLERAAKKNQKILVSLTEEHLK